MEEKRTEYINHEVIRDLSVLYVNGDCSEDSRRLVEKHIQECESCRKYLHDMMENDWLSPDKGSASLPLQEEKNGTVSEKTLLKQGLKKIRRRWIASLAAVACLPLVGVLGLMARNEVKGQGIAFSNLDEISCCRRYWKRICADEFDQALREMDYRNDYESILEAKQSGSPESEKWAGIDDYATFAEEKSQALAAWMQEYRELGYSLKVKGLSDAYRTPDGDGWEISFLLEESAPDGSKTSFTDSLVCTDIGFRRGSAMVSGRTDPKDPVFLLLDIAHYWEISHHSGLSDYLEYLEGENK